MKMIPGETGNSEVAVIEFDSKDEAAVALTRDQKTVGGNTIEVEEGSGQTLFVTNFSPEADEQSIYDVFQKVCSGYVLEGRYKRLTRTLLAVW